MRWGPLPFKWFVLAVGLLGAQGCGAEDPNRHIEAPILTEDAPKTSEEAAAQSEPPAKKPRSPRSR